MNNLALKLKKIIKKNNFAINTARKIRDNFFWKKREKAMLDYINKNYGHLFEKINNSPVCETEFTKPYPVWFIWFQGEKSMPEIVKICYDSLLKNAGEHKVNLITFDNYSEFADIPDFIVEKHKKEFISNVHFADIIRVFLLSRYGGLYVDATIYTSGKLPSFDGIPYSSGKWNIDGDNTLLTEYLIYCLPDNILMRICRDIFADYFKKEDNVKYYFMFYVIMFTAYKKVKYVKDLIDNMPESRRTMLDLYYLLNTEYNESEYKSLCNELRFHKLTHKEDFKKHTKNGKLTFYGYLYQEWKKEGGLN